MNRKQKAMYKPKSKVIAVLEQTLYAIKNERYPSARIPIPHWKWEWDKNGKVKYLHWKTLWSYVQS